VNTPFLVGAAVSLSSNFLFEVGLKQIKMRHHSPGARIKSALADLPRFFEDELREKIIKSFKDLGFKNVFINLEGFISENMNRPLGFKADPSPNFVNQQESAFYRARLIEHWGTGTLRMADACESLDLKLEFLSESGFFMVRFVKPEKMILSLVEQDLNDRQKKGLEHAKRTG
jgi:hypothetical protein